MATFRGAKLPPSGKKLPDSLALEIKNFLEFREFHGSKPVVFVGHTVADGDTVGTGYSLSRTFPGGMFVFQDVPRVYTLKLLEKIGLLDKGRFVFVSDVPPDIGVVLCDVHDSYRSRYVNGRLVHAIIDHHVSGRDARSAPIMIVDPSCMSASLIAYEIIQRAGVPVDERMALALQIGIISDAGKRFIKDLRSLFGILSTLSKISGVSYPDAVELAFPPLSAGEQNSVDLAVKLTMAMDVAGSILGRVVRVGATICSEEPLAPIVAEDLIYSDSPFRFEVTDPTRPIVLSVVFAITDAERYGKIETRASIRFSDPLVSNGFSADELGRLMASQIGGRGGGNYWNAGATLNTTPDLALGQTELLIKQYLRSRG